MARKIDLMEVNRYISRADCELRKQGLRVSVSTDFDEFLDRAFVCRGRGPTPYFDPRYNNINDTNGFWVVARDEMGRIAHLQAARIDDIGTRSLADFLESLDAYYVDPAAFRERGEYCKSPAPVTRKLKGRIVYHGEFWLRGGPGGVQGKGVVARLSEVATGLVAGRWSPDYSYAMVNPRVVRCGVAEKYGFNHHEPRGILWHRIETNEVLDEWIIWRSQCEIIEQIASAGGREG